MVPVACDPFSSLRGFLPPNSPQKKAVYRIDHESYRKWSSEEDILVDCDNDAGEAVIEDDEGVSGDNAYQSMVGATA